MDTGLSCQKELSSHTRYSQQEPGWFAVWQKSNTVTTEAGKNREPPSKRKASNNLQCPREDLLTAWRPELSWLWGHWGSQEVALWPRQLSAGLRCLLGLISGQAACDSDNTRQHHPPPGYEHELSGCIPPAAPRKCKRAQALNTKMIHKL